MSRVVLYDASVLYPGTFRDLLIRVGIAGLVQAKWTDDILDEVFRNVVKNNPDLDTARLDRTRVLMNEAIRDCLVTGYQSLIAALDLPDPDDRHVLAAAIRARADVIVTNNLRDFPSDSLTDWHIEALDADEFLLDLSDANAKVVWGCVQQIADSWRDPPGRPVDVLARLERCGLVRTVARLATV